MYLLRIFVHFVSSISLCTFFKRAKIDYLKDQLEHTRHFLGENFAYRDMKSVQIPIFPFCSQQNSNKNIVTIYSLWRKKECGFPTGLIIYFFDGRSPTGCFYGTFSWMKGSIKAHLMSIDAMNFQNFLEWITILFF